MGPIACVTIRTPSLEASEAAYGQFLHYRPVGRGGISAAESTLWGVPGLAGTPYLLMAPEAATDFVFRFVELPPEPGYRAFRRHGWQAAELIVDRVDPLAERLRNSPFEIVAPPLDLSFCPDIRAMQIRGPGGEIIYLTEFKKPVPGLEAPPARCAVDRTFIVIVGGKSLEGMQRYFRDTFGVPETPAMESRVQTMALEFGLSREHRFRLAALPLLGRCYIEADEMPPAAQPLPERHTGLPAGISMVSFCSPALAGNGRASAPPDSIPPYAGATGVECVRGAAGELLEIIFRP
ncbi:MAG: hypothetical protein JNK40_16070 [Chromatiales bacterium]|nr:hypothetical protein [Chromatiales bacterium]